MTLRRHPSLGRVPRSSHTRPGRTLGPDGLLDLGESPAQLVLADDQRRSQAEGPAPCVSFTSTLRPTNTSQTRRARAAPLRSMPAHSPLLATLLLRQHLPHSREHAPSNCSRAPSRPSPGAPPSATGRRPRARSRTPAGSRRRSIRGSRGVNTSITSRSGPGAPRRDRHDAAPQRLAEEPARRA